jgi:pimeloyl-ACP methyl ester carboxylesterase
MMEPVSQEACRHIQPHQAAKQAFFVFSDPGGLTAVEQPPMTSGSLCRAFFAHLFSTVETRRFNTWYDSMKGKAALPLRLFRRATGDHVLVAFVHRADPGLVLRPAQSALSADETRQLLAVLEAPKPDGRARPQPPPVLSRELKTSLIDWFGLQDVGTWRGQQPRHVAFSEAAPEACVCFYQDDQQACETAGCNWKAASCVPGGGVKSEWFVAGKSLVNSKSDGRLWRLIQYVPITLKDGSAAFASVLQPEDGQNTTVIVCPPGDVRDIPPPVAEALVEHTSAALVDGKRVVLCGHSMGGVYAQMVALQCLRRSVDTSHLYVVGSGAYMWTTAEERTELLTAFRDRWCFVAQAAGSKMDFKLFESPAERHELRLSGLPTVVLVDNVAEVVVPTDRQRRTLGHALYTEGVFVPLEVNGRTFENDSNLHFWALMRGPVRRFLGLSEAEACDDAAKEAHKPRRQDEHP